MKIEVGKYYKDNENNIWKVNGKTKNITCPGEIFHCEKMFVRDFQRSTSEGMFLGQNPNGYGLTLVSEFKGE